MRTDMDLFHQDLMYEFHAKELKHTEGFKQIADHAVKEIKTTVGWDVDVEVTIKPKAKDKGLFSVSISVFGAGEPVVVSKEGKHILTVLKKVKKTVLRQLHRISKKQVTRRRKLIFKELLAS